jgi:hypothetical protein
MKSKDYLHFYIGQWGILKASSKTRYEYEDGRWLLTGALYHEIRCYDHEFILELRPLSDMSDAEFKEWDKYSDYADDKFNYAYEMFAAQTAYLLSKGFDVFGLKEKGLAIYKTLKIK